MKNLLVRLCLAAAAMTAASFTVSAPASACEGEEQAAAPSVVTPEQVGAMIATSSVTPVDANRAETRAEFGVLPGAILLTGQEFGEGELPADHDAPLVFYCGSERCSSAPNAATTAMSLGYTNVSVMSAGIRGWVEAGYTTQTQAAPATADSES